MTKLKKIIDFLKAISYFVAYIMKYPFKRS